MPDELERTAPACQLIFLNDPREVQRWAHELNCTETMLRDAVRAVGNSEEVVRAHLAYKRGWLKQGHA